MSLSPSEIRAVVEELQGLVGARVDAIRVHAERALTLELHAAAGEVLLLLSAEPDRSRLHVASCRPPQPETPFPTQAVLRRELEGARLAGISVAEGERVVTLELLRARGPVRLVAELTGRSGQLLLVGGDGLLLARAGRPDPSGRPLALGAPYLPPAPPMARRPAVPRPPTSAPPPPGPPEGAPFPLSAAIEAEARLREEEQRLVEGRRRLREGLRAGLARSARTLVKLDEEAARVPAAEADRRRADLLKVNLGRIRRGEREVEVTEWTEDGPRQVRLSLDPALSPQENMERAYHRYRRIVDSAGRVQARVLEMRAREAALRALLGELEAAAVEALPRLEKEARRLGAGPARPPVARRRRHDEPRPPFRSFRSLPGIPILVGRGAEENDALTLRVARGNDLWLHARGLAGAHVVVRLEKGRAPDQETLLDAAHLAVHFSDARGEPQAEVAYTRAKHVRKAKGSAPGAVRYSQEKVMLLRVEPPRTARLLAEEEGEEALG